MTPEELQSIRIYGLTITQIGKLLTFYKLQTGDVTLTNLGIIQDHFKTGRNSPSMGR